MVATYWAPKAYNYWAVLAMEILCFLIWIDGFFFLLAGSFDAGYYTEESCYYSYNYTTKKGTNICSDPTTADIAYGNVVIISAAFAACLV
jgi:hypothetical protein